MSIQISDKEKRDLDTLYKLNKDIRTILLGLLESNAETIVKIDLITEEGCQYEVTKSDFNNTSPGLVCTSDKYSLAYSQADECTTITESPTSASTLIDECDSIASEVANAWNGKVE